MKPARILALVGGLLVFGIFSLVYAQGPLMFNYQGKLTTPEGALIDDTVQIVFSLYDIADAEYPFWTETHPAVVVEKWIFSVLLGSVNPLSYDSLHWGAMFDWEIYLGVKVGTDPEMTPRKQIVSSVFAISDGDWWRYEDDLYWPWGSVGIGYVEEPPRKAQLEVVGDSVCAGHFTSYYLDWETHVIHAEVTGSGQQEDAKAVWGYSKPVDNYGIGAQFEGGYRGVVGYVYSQGDGDPVKAVYGDAWGDGSVDMYGVHGHASGPSINYGVGGTAWYGTTNYGVRGYAGGGTTNYGVYAGAGGGTTNWAGYFDGNAKVVGTLTKGGGSFQIDHPLDPENKYLFHSFVESPDMKNVYDGVVILDASGQATVQLPAYFEALNRDFRYQLTAIGAPGPNLYVAAKIANNQFSIAGGEPGMEVSWQVTGIRHDKFAEANRIQVEVDKPDDEQGKYLHPEAYKLGQEYDIHYEQHKRMEQSEQRAKKLRERTQEQREQRKPLHEKTFWPKR